MQKPVWRSPSPETSLLPGSVDVWRAIVDVPQSHLQVYWTLLSPEEQNRAHRFKFARHRHRFIAAHGILRMILSRYLNQPPQALIFQSSSLGKPFLQVPPHLPPLEFNLAHSHQVAVYAVSISRQVGIDIELDRPLLDYHHLASRILNEAEQRQFFALPPGQHHAAFLAIWTRKEAALKACGKGLSLPMQRVHVTISPDAPARLLALDGQTIADTQWWMQDLFPWPLSRGALVIAGGPCSIRYWDYSYESMAS
ncbi:MAG: 4'-phosphopantetheinyl transferase superfamily protein [Nitrospirae bacterium]|nr:MAG: 4'-phosphopantetheinyl transferase superfamily protein [Nitrospirota bacterium]